MHILIKVLDAAPALIKNNKITNRKKKKKKLNIFLVA